MRRLKKKMLVMCTIALICAGVLCFSGCATTFVDVFLVQQTILMGTVLYIAYQDDVAEAIDGVVTWFKDLVFPAWAYGANEK